MPKPISYTDSMKQFVRENKLATYLIVTLALATLAVLTGSIFGDHLHYIPSLKDFGKWFMANSDNTGPLFTCLGFSLVALPLGAFAYIEGKKYLAAKAKKAKRSPPQTLTIDSTNRQEKVFDTSKVEGQPLPDDADTPQNKKGPVPLDFAQETERRRAAHDAEASLEYGDESPAFSAPVPTQSKARPTPSGLSTPLNVKVVATERQFDQAFPAIPLPQSGAATAQRQLTQLEAPKIDVKPTSKHSGPIPRRYPRSLQKPNETPERGSITLLRAGRNTKAQTLTKTPELAPLPPPLPPQMTPSELKARIFERSIEAAPALFPSTRTAPGKLETDEVPSLEAWLNAPGDDLVASRTIEQWLNGEWGVRHTNDVVEAQRQFRFKSME